MCLKSRDYLVHHIFHVTVGIDAAEDGFSAASCKRTHRFCPAELLERVKRLERQHVVAIAKVAASQLRKPVVLRWAASPNFGTGYGVWFAGLRQPLFYQRVEVPTHSGG
ncbi:hypothetical protein GCM10009537_05760 [Corynebacterium riegelii]